MEQRWSPRQAIRLNLVLYHTEMGLLRCQTRDLSSEGLFVETNGVHLPIEAPVDLDFVLPDNGASHLHRIRAKVVRNNGEGCGLIFREFTPAVSNFLAAAHYQNHAVPV
jgi:hypothetical protein